MINKQNDLLTQSENEFLRAQLEEVEPMELYCWLTARLQMEKLGVDFAEEKNRSQTEIDKPGSAEVGGTNSQNGQLPVELISYWTGSGPTLPISPRVN